MKRRICVVTNNRSDFNKLKPVLIELKKNKHVNLKLVVGGSHVLPDFGNTIDSIKQDGFKVDAIAKTIVEGGDPLSMTKSVGMGIQEFSTIFSFFKPDILVIDGDRFDALSAAVAAAMMNIRIAHLQGGEVTGTIDESIRHSITKLAHLHFSSTKKSAERIIKMGENPDNVHCTGCPSMDIISKIKIKGRQELLDIPQIKDSKVPLEVNSPFALFIQHPVTTTYEKAAEHITITLEAISDSRIQTIMIYPNIDAGSVDMMHAINIFERDHPNGSIIKKFKHIKFEDFIQLLANCSYIIGNSSSGIREACFFGVPAINIGTRQLGREHGHNVINVPHNKEKIKRAIKLALKQTPKKENIYGDGNASKKIAKILALHALPNIQKQLRY